MSIESFDPFAQGWGEITYEQMATLRRERPVAHTRSGFWYLARYEDCRRALGDSETFSNEGGLRGPGVVVPREERMINEMDAPDHTRLRKLEQSTLNYGNFRSLEPFIRKLSEGLVHALARNEEVDLVPTLVDPIPSQVAAHLIGVPVGDYVQFRAWTKEVCTSAWITDNRTERGEGLAGAHPEFADYIDTLAAERRASTQAPDDLLTRFVQAEIDGEQMSQVEIRIALAHLIIAGNDTTTHLLGNLLYRLIESPDLYARLRADRSLIPAAIEESLRFDAVVQLLTRRTRCEVEMSGVGIPAGARVVVGMASANRDPEAFGSDADVFCVDRVDPPLHLTFGYGPHLCLGANLARLEAEVMTNVLFDQVPHAKFMAGFEYQRLPAYWELGPQALRAELGS